MDERIKRKGELLLVSPVSSYQIVLGKLLPYLLGSMALVAIMTFKLGGSPWIILILLPVSLMFLSTSFLGAIIARSFKELSFVLIFLSVFLSGYIFFPAMFANIHAISIISPITLVVRLLENETVSISDYMFSTTSILPVIHPDLHIRHFHLQGRRPVHTKIRSKKNFLIRSRNLLNEFQLRYSHSALPFFPLYFRSS